MHCNVTFSLAYQGLSADNTPQSAVLLKMEAALTFASAIPDSQPCDDGAYGACPLGCNLTQDRAHVPWAAGSQSPSAEP